MVATGSDFKIPCGMPPTKPIATKSQAAVANDGSARKAAINRLRLISTISVGRLSQSAKKPEAKVEIAKHAEAILARSPASTDERPRVASSTGEKLIRMR